MHTLVIVAAFVFATGSPPPAAIALDPPSVVSVAASGEQLFASLPQYADPEDEAIARGNIPGFHRVACKPTPTQGSSLRAWVEFPWWGLGVWFAGLGALCALGWIMSRMTLASLGAVATSRSSSATWVDAIARALYAVILRVAAVYYYLSLPILLVFIPLYGLVLALLIIASPGFMVSVILLKGLPLLLFPPIFIMIFGTLYSIIRGIFVRAPTTDLSNILAVDKHPHLARVVADVAHDMVTEAPDMIVLETDSDIGVDEVGSVLRMITGRRSQRVLRIGIGALEGLTVGELRVILAQQFGRFMNHDAAGGVFVLRLRASLSRALQTMIDLRSARWFNPAWWFLRTFAWVFGEISKGASRLQEVLADRRAAFAYGSPIFCTALEKSIRRQVEFRIAANKVIVRVTHFHEIGNNVYASIADEKIDAPIIDAQTKYIFAQPASATDSCPAPADRIAWMTALDAPTMRVRAGDNDPSWSLFADRKAIEEALSERLRFRLAEQAGEIRLEGEGPKLGPVRLRRPSTREPVPPFNG